jgi:hypothetical protein
VKKEFSSLRALWCRRRRRSRLRLAIQITLSEYSYILLAEFDVYSGTLYDLPDYIYTLNLQQVTTGT